MKKIIRGSLIGLGLLGVAITVLVLGGRQDTPSFESVKSSYQISEMQLADRDGGFLHSWRQDLKTRTLSWVSYSDLSSEVVEAVLKSEDRNFFKHHGVDWGALAASFYQRMVFGSPRGASTISMQVVKLVRPSPSSWSGFWGKWKQIVTAFELERQWSKEQILEAYLNLTGFRGEMRGLAASSWGLFNKAPSDLTKTEATLLAVLIRSPNASEGKWQERACWQEPSLCESLKNRLTWLSSSGAGSRGRALHLAQRLAADGRRGLVQTPLHSELQAFLQEQVQSQIQKLKQQNVSDAAVLVVENSTGEVWGYVGGAGPLSTAEYVDGVRALRQAGSTLKPFLYATAFEKNILHPDSWIEDSAVDIVFDRGVYKPQNHDRHFYGWVKVKTALGSSLNVPAVKVFKLLNDDAFWTKLKALGFKKLQEPEHYGPALALGVADVSLEDLVQAYRTLARGGLYSDLVLEKGQEIPAAERIFKEESARQVLEILSENQNRALGFGLSSVLAHPGTAVKTGTSKDMRDNWCIGMNGRFTVGVWVGNFDGSPMWNVMGVTGAAPIWQKTMQWLQEKFPAPPLVLSSRVADTKPQLYPGVRIVYPQDGMVLALDPAIPAKHQKMPLLLENPKGKRLHWRINDTQKIKATGNVLWSPLPGRHRFALFEDDKKLGEVSVLVK